MIAASVSVSLGTGTSPSASIGISIARNFIGWSEYGDKDPLEVMAYISNSFISADGIVSLLSTAVSTIDALIAAISVAIAGSTGSSFAVSAGGLYAENKLATFIKAYIDGSTITKTGAGGIGLTARDTSTITATGATASVAVSLAGSNSGALSIGLAIARNFIANEVMSFINNTTLGVITSKLSGPLTLLATTNATITVLVAAVSVAVGASGSNAFTFSGGGAVAENVLLANPTPHVEGHAA